MSPWRDLIGTGSTVLLVHTVEVCAGEYCCIHRPSRHPLNQARLNWRGRVMERICGHGLGHPDPDDAAWRRRTGRPVVDDHRCDGCCRGPAPGTVVDSGDMFAGEVRTPWTASQVDSLNAYQASGYMHPYTCVNRAEPGHPEGPTDRGVLVATTGGLACPSCDYTQTWAHTWAADRTWEQLRGGATE